VTDLNDFDKEIIKLLRLNGPTSRTALAQKTGASQAKMTFTIRELIRKKVITEIGLGDPTGGRRSRLLHFNRAFGCVAGIDLGATSLDIALADFSGEILSSHSEPADVREGPEIILGRIGQLLSGMLSEAGQQKENLLGIGLGVPGPVEFSSGVLIAPPIMPGWHAYSIRKKLAGYFPNARVMVDNDVNIMALGELNYGAGRNVDNFIFVKIGTGIGAGIIVDGGIYRGNMGCAGDIGHICVDKSGPVCHCGNIGCLEVIASGEAIAKQAVSLVKDGRNTILASFYQEKGSLTAVDVARAVEQGDILSIEIVQNAGLHIGETLAGLVNFFNPDLIIIGGGVSKIGIQLLNSIRKSILNRSLPLATRHLKIDPSPMGDQAGIHGGIALALDYVLGT
jgi:glucokinase-like ROK family protein